jgi:ribosomal protein L11 methylase PrmA
LKREGRLLLAGILNHQFANVEAAYREAGMVRTALHTEGEWSSGVFRFDGPDRPR